MADPGRIAYEIANAEAMLMYEEDPRRIEELKNYIHGLECELQHEIAKQIDDDFDPAEVR